MHKDIPVSPMQVVWLFVVTSACSSAHLRSEPANAGPRIMFVDASAELPAAPQVRAARYCDLAVAGSRVEPFAPCPDGYALGRIEQELQHRWNASGAATSGFLGFAPHATFGWESTCGFPHATFTGGTPEAYACFGSVVLGFFAHEDNLRFAVDNDLLDFPLYHGVYGPGPNEVSGHTTLRALVKDFAAGWASYDREHRSQFYALCERIACDRGR